MIIRPLPDDDTRAPHTGGAVIRKRTNGGNEYNAIALLYKQHRRRNKKKVEIASLVPDTRTKTMPGFPTEIHNETLACIVLSEDIHKLQKKKKTTKTT